VVYFQLLLSYPSIRISFPRLTTVQNNPPVANAVFPSDASPVNLPAAAFPVFANVAFHDPYPFDYIFSGLLCWICA